MQRKSIVFGIVLALLVSGLWLSAVSNAGGEPVAKLPPAEALPTLEVTIESLSGGNFSSYSMPTVDTVGTLDFEALSRAAENSETIKFLKKPDDPDEMGYWYIPVPGPMRVDEVSDKFGRQQVRLVAEGASGSRLRIELDYFKDHPETVRVWLIHEYRGFVDSVAYGEAPLEGPILKAQASASE